MDERERIRRRMEKSENAVLVASYGTFSQGIDIKAIHNVVFGSPYKSQIRVLQSIGRGLRALEGKEEVVLYDIVDDMRSDDWDNYTWRNYQERLKIYREEDFNVSDSISHSLPKAGRFVIK